MTALPETQAQRWARLHRRIKQAGRVPAMTLAGCEVQAAMLDSGELQPLPAPSKEMQRVMANDERRRAERAAARFASEDDEAAEMRAEYREAAADERRSWEEGGVAGSDAFRYRDPTEEAD